MILHVFLLLFQSPFQAALDSALPGATLDALLYRPAVKHALVVRKPVTIENAAIRGDDVNAAVYAMADVTLVHCVVSGRVSAIGGSVTLDRCAVVGLVYSADRDVTLTDSRVRGSQQRLYADCGLYVLPAVAAYRGAVFVRRSAIAGGSAVVPRGEWLSPPCTADGGAAVEATRLVIDSVSRLRTGSGVWWEEYGCLAPTTEIVDG